MKCGLESPSVDINDSEDQVKVNPKENLLYRSGNNKILEFVFCKKRQKIVPDQLLVWGIRAL